MDEMPDYSKYTLSQLYDVFDHIDREKYPDRFTIIVQELERREFKPLVQVESLTHPQPRQLAVEFRGSPSEYFRIWIVNLCLTLLTFGIFSPWAKVRKKRYFYSHTLLDGTPFQFLGQPIPILKGRIIAAFAFSSYYVSTHFISCLLPYVLTAGMALAPWMIIRSAAFNARYSAFRNITFRFEGRYVETLKVIYVLGLIPALVIGTIFDWWGKPALGGTVFAVFGLSFPWWIRGLKSYIVEHTSYGGEKGFFSATGGQFFRVYFISGLIAFGGGIIAVTLSTVLYWSKLDAYWVAVVLIYAGYALAYAYLQAHSGNLLWNHTRLGPLRFQSTLLGLGMAKLYITNALAIIASLGLLIPWAVIRTVNYRVENLRVLLEGDLTDFQGIEPGAVRAIGAETMDFFDLDISL